MSRQRKQSLAGVIDPGYQGNLDYYSTKGERKSTTDTGDPLGCFLVLPGSIAKVNGKLQQPYPCSTTNGHSLQEWRHGSPHQVKNMTHWDIWTGNEESW